ncbi:hypothetical protein CEP51_002490 [Fusarium floridanum]|uniref:Uncharacterized protein n=1 Tax=Fusarium floridanum TaxID=1325733 RepID=A0A428SB66_9HYPO|nr:hypothetical protein CEP51_002490 [Fusarium floridanum]
MLINRRRRILKAFTQDLFVETGMADVSKGDRNRSLRNLPRCLLVACDRHWFGDDYTPFKTWLTDSRGVKLEAIGVGNIMLPVDLSNGKRGEIFLRNVLHFPDAVCNSIGSPIYIDYNIDGGDGMNFANDVQTLRDDGGRPSAYFERGSKVFYILKLGGPPSGARLGPCPLDEGKGYMISLYWPESERMRFEASKAQAEAFLSDSERAWLKEHWGNEFKFLAAYELSIYKDEDREEGRAIMRTMMAKEKESKESDEHTHDDSHLVDHYFSDDELEEIELQFGNSKIFLEEELGFSIYNDEHCRVAKRNIREFLGKTG